MRAFASKGQLSAFAIELRPPRDQFFDALGGVFHQHPGGFWIAQAITRIQSILQMQADFVLVTKRGSDPALRELGAGRSHIAFDEN